MMKLHKKLIVQIGATLLLMILVAAVWGASIIQIYYRMITTEADRLANTQRYHNLALDELSATGTELISIRAERYKLYYWFHSRCWDIDEGCESQSRPWKDLLIYWRNN